MRQLRPLARVALACAALVAVVGDASAAVPHARALHASPIFMRFGRHGFTPTSLAQASDGAVWALGQPGLLLRFDAAGVEKLDVPASPIGAVAAVTGGDVWVATSATGGAAISLRRLHASGAVAASVAISVPTDARPARRIALAAELDGRLALVVSGGANGAVRSQLLGLSAGGATLWTKPVTCSDGPCVGDGVTMDGSGAPIVIADRTIKTPTEYVIAQLVFYRSDGSFVRRREFSSETTLGAAFDGCRAVAACGLPDDVVRGATSMLAFLWGGVEIALESFDGFNFSTLPFPSATQRAVGITPTAIAAPRCAAQVLVGVPSLPIRRFTAPSLGACAIVGGKPAPISLGVPALVGRHLQIVLACVRRCSGTLAIRNRRGHTVARALVGSTKGYHVLDLALSSDQAGALAAGAAAAFRAQGARAAAQPAVPFKMMDVSLTVAKATVGVGEANVVAVHVAAGPARRQAVVRVSLVGPALRVVAFAFRLDRNGAGGAARSVPLFVPGHWRATAIATAPAAWGSSSSLGIHVTGPDQHVQVILPVNEVRVTCAPTDPGTPLVAGGSVTVRGTVAPAQAHVPVHLTASSTTVHVADDVLTASDGSAETTFVVTHPGTWTFRAVAGGAQSSACTQTVG